MNIGFERLRSPLKVIIMAAGLSGMWQFAQAASVMTPQDASRLLTQATFGPTVTDLDRAVTLTSAAWVDEQIAKQATYHRPVCQSLPTNGKVDRDSRTSAWWKIGLTAQDQLRQRVALALSEILVVSDIGSTFANDGAYEGMCYYYDILVRNALGNYRTLLDEVTLSPQMGMYLSMMLNDKPNPSAGRRADENFARELMQLFTVGLNQLNADGSVKRDSAGNALPSYSQADVEGLARTLTGWTFSLPTWTTYPYVWFTPMKAFQDHHDTGLKTIIGGVSVPAGMSARQDLTLALDTLFKHPNVGPFIGRQLIQKLVTSNPSPAYINRISAVFANDGKGVRGNLAAVVRAVLLDAEARNGVATNANFGKPRENLLRQTGLWRLLKAQPALIDGRYQYKAVNALNELSESAVSAGSVFNFFQPSYAPAGEIRDSGLVTPEFQLSTEPGVTMSFNRIFTAIYYDYVGRPGVNQYAIRSDFSPLLPYATNTDTLLSKLDVLMFGGTMPSAFRTTLRDYLNQIPTGADGGRTRLQDALYIAFTSPQFQIQR